jgi:phenylacetate-CoA ligase
LSPVSGAARECYDPKIETAPYRKLEEIQARSLRRVVAYAYDNCPFYHVRWKRAGFRPGDVNSIRDFRKKIPSFTKDDLRAESNTMDITGGITSCARDRLRGYAMTSGTTGINTFIGLGHGFLETFVEEVGMREYWMAKMRPGMTAFMIPAGWHFLGIAQNMVFTRMGVTCISSWGTLFHRFLPDIVKTLRTYRPDYFHGLPWEVFELMEECGKAGIEPRELFANVKYMSLAAETVTPGFRKRVTEETDVQDVFESGGSVDGLWGGSDCHAHAGHHIWMDQIFSELVGVKGDGEIEGGGRGRIITTNLRLGGPLYIRFLGEDLVSRSREQCECGRTHERIELYDRLSNTFRVGQRMLAPYDVSVVIEEVCGQRLFTVVNPEHDPERLRVRIDKGNKPEKGSSLADELDRLARKRLGIGMEVEWVDWRTLPFVHRKVLQLIREGPGPGKGWGA